MNNFKTRFENWADSVNVTRVIWFFVILNVFAFSPVFTITLLLMYLFWRFDRYLTNWLGATKSKNTKVILNCVLFVNAMCIIIPIILVLVYTTTLIDYHNGKATADQIKFLNDLYLLPIF